MRVGVVARARWPLGESRLHDGEGREGGREKRGGRSGREERKESTRRERGRHKKKIIEQMLIQTTCHIANILIFPRYPSHPVPWRFKEIGTQIKPSDDFVSIKK
jgi:hypothetical protein